MLKIPNTTVHDALAVRRGRAAEIPLIHQHDLQAALRRVESGPGAVDAGSDHGNVESLSLDGGEITLKRRGRPRDSDPNGLLHVSRSSLGGRMRSGPERSTDSVAPSSAATGGLIDSMRRFSLRSALRAAVGLSA